MKYKEEAINKCMHAVGISNRVPYKRHGKLFLKSYRNHYDAGERDVPVWEELVRLGYAYKNKLYHLTPAGFDWLQKEIGITIKREE